MTTRRPTPPRAPKPSGAEAPRSRELEAALEQEEAAGIAPRSQAQAPVKPRAGAAAVRPSAGSGRGTSGPSTRPGGRSAARRSPVTRRASAPSSSSPASAPASRGSSRPAGRSTTTARRTTAADLPASAGILGGPRLTVGGNFSVSWRLLLFALVVAVAFILITPTLRLYVSQREAERTLNEQVAAAEARNAELQRQIDRWSDPGYVEAQARERLGYVLPGQQPYVVVDPEVVVGEEEQQAYEESLATYTAPAGPWYSQVVDSIEIAGAAEAAGEGDPAVDPGVQPPAGEAPAEAPAEPAGNGEEPADG